ncbi:MAG: ABC transporter permease [Paracoccaceae bacterium]
MSALLAQVWGRMSGRAGLLLAVAVLLLAGLGPLIGPDPNRIDVPAAFQGGSLAHLFGTDNLGRDLFARAAVATRTAVLIAVTVVAVSALVGAALGVLAGLAGRWVDRVILAGFDIVNAYPPVILALALVALYGKGLLNIVVVVTILFIPQFGRMARAQTLSQRDLPYVDALRILGMPRWRIVLRHVLPNVAGPLIVLASMNLPVVVTVEAGLSFLGLGVQPPTASLGTLIRDGYVYLDRSWWPIGVASVILAVATLGATLLGEAVRDATDPKLRGVGR